MFLQPTIIETESCIHEELGACSIINKFSNGNAIVTKILPIIKRYYIIDLRDTDYDI